MVPRPQSLPKASREARQAGLAGISEVGPAQAQPPERMGGRGPNHPLQRTGGQRRFAAQGHGRKSVVSQPPPLTVGR
jgi:hypothetical protein